MMRILKVFSLSVVFSLIVSFGAQAATSTAGNAQTGEGKGRPPSRDLLKCVYTPQADSQSSSLPTISLGFKFYLEPNNNNEMAVDTFSLGNDSQPVKQIGHAELIASQRVGADGKVFVDPLAGLTLAEDSPFEFAISFASSSETSKNARFSATIESISTFAGEAYSQLSVQCRKAP